MCRHSMWFVQFEKKTYITQACSRQMKNVVRMVQTTGCTIKKRENQWKVKELHIALSTIYILMLIMMHNNDNAGGDKASPLV